MERGATASSSPYLLDQLRETLGDGSDEDRLQAVRMIEPRCEQLVQADAFLWAVVSRMLRANRLRAVAKLIWTLELFDERPECVAQIWRTIFNEPKTILLGCGSAGKTYSSAAWFLLDWLRDPQFTNTKVISSTAGHAKSNVFSTLHKLHESSRIRLPGIRLDGFIGLNSQNRHAGISRVSIPPGASGRGALQGFHPIPRTHPDPIFGQVGRVRAFIDEGEECPVGLWKGIDNMLLSLHGTDLIKICSACNPRDVLSPLAMYAQPQQGWTRVKVDVDKEWYSTENWKVLRIDGCDLENVRERKLIYPGFMTFPGYENLRLKAGGNTPEYWTMARGMYPLEGAANTVIPIAFLDELVGTLLFVGQVVPCGAIDVAFEGDDECIFCAGRYGQATGWRDPLTGKVHFFEGGNRYCLQVDQFFTFPKLRTIALAQEVMDLCKKLAIQPEWFCCDRTGVGVGLHDALIASWDPETMGINWGQDATERKILEDDTTVAIEEFEGISCEMYMAMRRWIEFSYMRIAPSLDSGKLFKEMTSRKYEQTGKGPTGLGRVRLQPKKEFKRLYGWSPDRCDALVMLLHVCRMRGPERARMALRSRVTRRPFARTGIIEKSQILRWDPKLDA